MGGRTVFNTKNIKSGDIFTTKHWGKLEVITYNGCTSIIIKFLDTGNIQTVSQQSLLSGSCKDKASIRVFGVGINDYNGKVSRSGKGKKKHYEKFYLCWKSMLQRCYDKKELEKHPTYEKNFVCKQWHSLSNFKRWFDENYKEGYQLDKDILSPFENVYSPDNCWFIPQDVNKLMAIRTKQGNLKGVYKSKSSYCATLGAGERNKSTVKCGFITPEEAFTFYCKNKKDFLLKRLRENKDNLCPLKYEKCYNFWDKCKMEHVIKRWVK